MTKTEEQGQDEKFKAGVRASHQAAFLANMRMALSKSIHFEGNADPAVGIHAVVIHESGQGRLLSAGATPPLSQLLGHLGALQGLLIQHRAGVIASGVQETFGALLTPEQQSKIHAAAGLQTGDVYDDALGTTRCVGCEDGDPTGAHAKEELEKNARAWVGLLCLIGREFYGEHLPEPARKLLGELLAYSLPADAEVS